MRDEARLRWELKDLEQEFGRDRVFWHRSYEWLCIKSWPLPRNLNRASTEIIVLLPPNYGHGDKIRDAFIDPEIRALNPRTGRYEELPHYYKEYPYAKLSFADKHAWREKGWQYICIHALCNGPRANIRNYLNHVYKFLAEPFRDWQAMFASYQ